MQFRSQKAWSQKSVNRFYVTPGVNYIATVLEKQAYHLKTNFLKNMKEYGHNIRQILDKLDKKIEGRLNFGSPIRKHRPFN